MASWVASGTSCQSTCQDPTCLLQRLQRAHVARLQRPIRRVRASRRAARQVLKAQQIRLADGETLQGTPQQQEQPATEGVSHQEVIDAPQAVSNGSNRQQAGGAEQQSIANAAVSTSKSDSQANYKNAYRRSQAYQDKESKRLLTIFIKDYSISTMRLMWQQDPTATVSTYLQRMTSLCKEAEKDLNEFSISAIILWTAKVYLSASRRDQGYFVRPENQRQVEDFLQTMVDRLQPFLGKLDERGASNILWSLARLKVHPDKMKPGLLDELCQQFLTYIDDATDQALSTVLLSCVCLRPPRPCNGEFLPAVVDAIRKQNLIGYSSQSLANIATSLAKLSLKPSFELIAQLCAAFQATLESDEVRHRPQAQHIANFAWALQELWYRPNKKLGTDMAFRMCSFIQQSSRAPTTQGISSFLLAAAALRLEIKADQAGILLAYLLKQDKVLPQELSNTARSLAMLGVLTMADFDLILTRLSQRLAKWRSPIADAGAKQMYQALDWLQSAVYASEEEQQKWNQLHSALQKLTPRAEIRQRVPDLQVSRALTELELNFEVPQDAIKGYLADAVVRSKNEGEQPLIVVVEKFRQFINDKSRLTGRMALRKELMEREGALVVLPFLTVITDEPGEGTLASFMEPRLEAAAGGNLDGYRL